MERISRRKLWLAISLLVGVATIFLGKNWLFEDSSCPRLQDLLLYVITIIGWIICTLFVLTTRNDSLITKFISIVAQVILVLLLVTLSGSILVNQANIKAVYCNPSVCEKAEYAKNLRESGKLDAAEQIARTCMDDISKNVLPQECSDLCARELSYTLYEKAGKIITDLPITFTLDYEGRCELAVEYLDEAADSISQYDYSDLSNLISERKMRLLEKCVIAEETPVPVLDYEILRTKWRSNQAYVDVRVLDEGKFLSDIDMEDFILSQDGTELSISVEEKSSDENLCMIAVVDDSGSIYEGIEGVRLAIEKINSFRKPGDELGMVLFSGNEDISVTSSPATESLNANDIKGQGQLTALWDGIQTGLDVAQTCESENRYVLVLTDGIDNDSKHLEGDDATKARSIADRAVQENVNICVIGITNKVDDNSLNLVSAGCGYQYSENYDEVADKLQILFGYVYGFYRITVDPSDISVDGNVVLRVRNAQGVPVEFVR